MNKVFMKYKIEKIVNECFELVKQGKVGYLEFSEMSLKQMAERIDREKLIEKGKVTYTNDILMDKKAHDNYCDERVKELKPYKEVCY